MADWSTESPPPVPGKAARRKAERERNRRLEVEFLEALRTRLPAHPGIVESLGCLYTEMGRYREGLHADRQMVEMQPHSPVAWYNLACSLVLTHQVRPAFDALEKAVDLGYADAEWMQEDEDLEAVRQDPRFGRLIARMLARKV